MDDGISFEARMGDGAQPSDGLMSQMFGACGFEHVRVDGALGQVYRELSTGKLYVSIP